jgi:hypothetical protein
MSLWRRGRTIVAAHMRVSVISWATTQPDVNQAVEAIIGAWRRVAANASSLVR